MQFLAALSLPEMRPEAFWLGPIPVRWYGLAYIAGLVFAAWYMKRLVTTPRLWNGQTPTMTAPQVDDFFLWMVAGVILGGRLGHVLFYDPLAYIADPLKIVRLMDGGMSFHGGFLGCVIAAWIYGRKIGAGLDRMLDLGAAVTPVGLGLGRVANFINQELWGGPTDLPWGVIFPDDPTQTPRHASQLYEAALEGLVLFMLVRIATHRFRALAIPGRAAGIFALWYGVSRIAVEFVRLPDRDIGYLLGPLTMGMLLSLPLVAVGIWLLLRSRRQR
ncbi:MAG: prolipoprotein diacylglyceryl transferase [Aestuariivirga sp.]